MHSHIRPHHQRAIENLKDAYQHDKRFPALIIGGSVAKGCARDDSDVDFLIVATDEEFASRKAKADLFINRSDLCDYSGGYVDGKIINVQYLEDLAEKGNEPSRAAFDGAFMAYSHIEGLEALFGKIHVYPEAGHAERIKAFYCQAFIQQWLMNEAERHDNLYAKSRAATQMTLWIGRLILAHNRVLYPYHKWLFHYLEKCEKKPVDLIKNINELLNKPGLDQSTRLFQSAQSFHEWGITDLEAYTWFMENVEWSWMQGNTPLEDL